MLVIAWHLIREGDIVTATTFRKVAVGLQSQDSEKVKIKLTIQVQVVDFDPEGRPYTSWLSQYTESDCIQ